MAESLTQIKFSFIVIGRNEGWKLPLCLDSVQKTVLNHNITNYEILYIDSRSTDNSLKIAAKIPNLRSYLVTGECNAAIARNIGGKEATGDILVFLDGDMELQDELLSRLFNEKKQLVHPFISAQCCHRYYNKKWEVISNCQKSELPESDRMEPMTGGFFIVTEQYWNKIGGMNTKFTVSEDYDFGLRMAKRGVYALMLNCIGVIHHTTSYTEKLNKIVPRYKYVGVLERNYFFDWNFWKSTWRENLTANILLLSFLGVCFNPNFIFAYILAMLSRVVAKGKLRQLPQIIWFFLRRDLIFIVAFLFFYPKEKEIRYKQIYEKH